MQPHTWLDNPKFLERFWSKVEKSADPDGCWLWTGKPKSSGYGQIHFNGRVHRAHHVSYEIAYGPLAPDYFACHQCDIRYPLDDLTYRRCVRPDHLFSGTSADNNRDCMAKGRRPCGDRNGSRTHPERLRRGDNHPAHLHPERVARGDSSGARLHPEALPFGERNGSAKLTADAVSQIFKMLDRGDSQRVIAAHFGVSHATVGNIKNHHNWQHLRS